MNLGKLTSNRWFGRLLLVAFLAGAAFLLARNPGQYAIFLQLDLADIATLFAVNLASFLVTGAVSWHLLRSVGASVPWSTNMALTFLANFLNYFGPAQPGMGAKALYLKAALNVTYTDFAVATGTNALVMVLVSGLVGVAVVAWTWAVEGVRLTELGGLSLLMALSALAMPILWPWALRFIGVPRHWTHVLDAAIAGIARLWGQHEAMVAAVALIALQYAVSAFAIWLSYRAIGADLGYPLALLIAAFLSVANIVPVTPNNIGVSELVMGTVAQFSGVGFADGLVAGAVMRALHLLISVLALPYANWQLRRALQGDIVP